LQATAETVENASKLVVVLNFSMNLFLGGAMQQLFSAIRKLTIMVHLLIINVRIPPNAQSFFRGLLSFVTFDIIELGPYIRQGLNLTDTDVVVNDNFMNLGYDSEYFVINFGTLLLVMSYLAIMLMFYACTPSKGNSSFVRCRNRVTRGLVWNSVFSFMLESYMLLSISAVVNFIQFKFEDLGTALSSNLTALVVVLLVSFPIFTLAFLCLKKRKLDRVDYKEKYGALYETLRTTRMRKSTMFEPMLSMYRMLLLTFTLIFLQDYRYF
jgi:hypothetical protein